MESWQGAELVAPEAVDTALDTVVEPVRLAIEGSMAASLPRCLLEVLKTQGNTATEAAPILVVGLQAGLETAGQELAGLETAEPETLDRKRLVETGY